MTKQVINCEMCDKEIFKLGARKYCSSCRRAKDKELSKERIVKRREDRESKLLLKNESDSV